MIFWCQSCGEQHTQPHVTSANITTCARCGGSSFATWKPTQFQSLSQEAVRDEVLEEAARVCEAYTCDHPGGMIVAGAIGRAIRALKREPNAAARVSAIEKSKVVRTCRKCKTSWEAPVNFCPQCGGVNDEMVDRFLSWPLPYSVCADLCATKQGPGRIGTNLLSATEAKQMLEYVLAHSYKTVPASAPGASDE